MIEQIFGPLDASEVIARLDQARIANAAVNNITDVWNHPQLAARKRWSEVDSPEGKIEALLPPGINDTYEPRMDPVPAIGEHTDSILKELGFTMKEIERLHEVNAI